MLHIEAQKINSNFKQLVWKQIAQEFSHVNQSSSLKAQCLLRTEVELQKTSFVAESK